MANEFGTIGSASKIAVANLADGTDGQLITWDAAGVAAVVPVGTATHVLTSNGAGAAPTFQVPPGATPAVKHFQARLTLETAVPYSTADQTAKTILYLSPLDGNIISLYDGASAWIDYALAEKSIKSTDDQSGATHNGTKVIDGLTDTSQLVVGMLISGTGVGAGSVIDTIDTATQITGTVNSTASATVTVTFKLALSTVYDVFVFNNAGTPKLEFCKWTNLTTRATALTTQDGIHVKSGVTTRRYVGTICTTTTNGQMEDSASSRLVWNYYNRKFKQLKATDTTDSWQWYTASTWREARAQTTYGTSRIGMVIGWSDELVNVSVATMAYSAGGAGTFYVGMAGIGLDASNANSATRWLCSYVIKGAANAELTADYQGYPGVGFHYFTSLEWADTINLAMFCGDFPGNIMRAGLMATING